MVWWWWVWGWVRVALSLLSLSLSLSFSASPALVFSSLSLSLHLPFPQDFAYLSLEPKALEIDMTGALSLEKIRVNVPSVFTVAIGTEKELRYVRKLHRDY